VNDETDDLLREFSAWVERKGRDADLMLLDELLQLRSAYDELEPTYWPAGSVEHLLLGRLPSKGPTETPAPDAVTETLDAYFRFLRSTGRMSHRSADPKELTREARRNARRMHELAGDRVNWSQNKVLADFGRTIGIELDGAPDLETLQQRLEQIQQAWNELPVSERRRLMPRPGDPTGEEADDLPGREVAMRLFGTDDQILALLMTFADRLPTGELPPPEVVWPQLERSSYLRQVLALAEWVGEGRAVTSTGVLRPAPAKEVAAELGLGEWTRAQLRREYRDESLPGVAAIGLDAWIEREAERPWTRAADCQALHRLWVGAIASGRVRVSSTKAVGVVGLPSDDEDRLSVGLRALVGLMQLVLDSPYHAVPIVFALLTSYVEERRLVTWDEIVTFHQIWRRSPAERAELADLEEPGWFDAIDLNGVHGALGLMADTGLYVESDEGVALSDAGDVFVTAWLRFMESD
jgi:hypothetical protein